MATYANVRKPERTAEREQFGYCEEHAKRLWTTRKAAKRAIREYPQTAARMREYRCDTRQGWHIGHMPYAVVRGRRTMREVLQHV